MFSKRVVCFAFFVGVVVSCTTNTDRSGPSSQPAVFKIFADGVHPPPPPAPLGIPESPTVLIADGVHPPPKPIPPTPLAVLGSPAVLSAEGVHPPPPPVPPLPTVDGLMSAGGNQINA